MKLWSKKRDSQAAQAGERAAKETTKEPDNLIRVEKEFIQACVKYYRNLIKNCGYARREALIKTVKLTVRLLINNYQGPGR